MKSFFKCVIYIVSKEMLDIFHTEQFLQIRWTFESNFFMDSRIEILKRGYSPFCASVLLMTKVGHQI